MYVIAQNGSPIYGGGEIWIARLLAALQTRGHQVKLFCRNQAVAARAEGAGIETRVHRLGGDLMIPHALTFARTLRQERPDGLILTTFKKIWLGGLAAHRAGVPLVIARVGVAGLLARNWTYHYPLRHWVHRVVLNSQALRAPFLEGLDPVVMARVLTIRDGVPELPRRTEPAMTRQVLGLPSRGLLVGAVARLSRQKRLDRLIDALAQLPSEVHVVVAGEGPERAELERRAIERNLGGRFHLVGFREDVGDLLAALDVFVVSSDYEGIANAMLEAMAAGVPVVSTPVEGAAEALAPDHEAAAGVITGWDPQSIAAAIRGLLDRPDRRESLGALARKRARERFGFDRMVDEWEALLTDVRPET